MSTMIIYTFEIEAVANTEGHGLSCNELIINMKRQIPVQSHSRFQPLSSSLWLADLGS